MVVDMSSVNYSYATVGMDAQQYAIWHVETLFYIFLFVLLFDLILSFSQLTK